MALHDEKLSSENSKTEDQYVTTTTPHSDDASEFYDPSKESIWTRLGVNFESFKPAPGVTNGLVNHGDVDPLRAKENPILQQKMKPRHLTMIAVGGSIGTGLFIGSGQALRNGGPLGILIAWLIIGVMMINVTQALGELCILYPVSGGFYTLAVRFLDPSFGMAMGWNYFAQWAVVLPLEITAAGITVQYWEKAAAVPIAVWITVFFVAIIAVNVFGTLGYAEEEFWSSCLKLAAVIIFIIIGIVLNVGAGKNAPYNEYVGGRYWRDPGPLSNGFKGICAVFVTAAFSFAGTELVGLAATETPNPRKALPGAVKGTFWRITLIYISSLLIIGLNVPYNNETLLGGGSGAGTSPFVIMASLAGLKGLDSFLNIVICISVLSIGLSCVYAGSRVLTALAETGYAPKIFTYVDKSGRPLWSVIAVLAFGPIAYVNVVSAGDTVFNWLLALSGLSTLFTWGSICLCHIRFRKAWRVQGHHIDELPYRAIGGVYGSWCGLILVCLVLIAQFYVAVWPLGGRSSDPAEAAQDFFLVWLAAPILLFFWLCAYLKNRTLPYKAHEIDLDTGRKAWYTAEEMNTWRAERKQAPFLTRLYRIFFSY
ncbi:amino acid permease GAP1 [Sporobolomyces koalae]|uniref:amino acid permease GAP1 n=1 Tax=Sporobolomyces koalae TaxID=500713 RepID=UPI00317ADFAC